MLNHRIRCMYRRWHRLKRITLISFIHELTHNNIRDILIQHYFIAELWPAKRACGAPWVSKSSHTRKFGNHVTVHRPPARCPSVRTTGIPMFTLTLSSYLGAQGKADCTSMLSSIDSCQNRVPADQYHLTVSRAQVSTHQGRVFFEVIRC